ncbi:MAG TPA: transcription antitermination factor NusB [Bacteroidia bacterium]|nr:transcription antitermination factor NusB [Bacteroidia bacterium]
MQALYAYFQHEKADVKSFERDLFKNLDRIYDLYLSILALLCDLHHVAMVKIDERRNKRLPDQSDLNPIFKFVNNTLLQSLSKSEELKKQLEKRKISWQNDMDLVRKLYNEISGTELYRHYQEEGSSSIQEDRDFILALVNTQLSENDFLHSYFEEKNIHWSDDSFVAFNSVIRNLEAYNGEFSLQPLLKDEKDDLEFMSQLFTKTIQYKARFDELIDKHTKNWEIERIASMDMLLMEMALAEILYIPAVPVKASLNEYIDISKEYSTPNSKVFVNGVLDKIISELRQQNQIQKTGRGLKES